VTKNVTPWHEHAAAFMDNLAAGMREMLPAIREAQRGLLQLFWAEHRGEVDYLLSQPWYRHVRRRWALRRRRRWEREP
jgi:hypothetical protein